MSVGIFLMIFAFIVFFAPEMNGYFLEFNNFIPADPLKTPLHIAPVWYFTPFYSMLRAVTSEFMIPMWIFAAVLLSLLIRQTKDKKQQIKYAGILVVLAATFYLLDAKFWGVMVMGGSVVIFFFLPWLDNSPVKSIRYRPQFHKYIYGVFVVTFVILGYLGIQAPSPVGEKVSQIGTLIYFGFFLAMPWWSKMGEFKQVPKRVTFVAH
jgi:ubiquinol-cytochrome c reductase cytochrome b subunit